MTILVQIKNKDAARAIVVRVQDVEKATYRKKESSRDTIGPGESRDYHIHMLRDLLIEELSDAE